MNFQIIKLGLPLILSQGIQTLMLLTDRYILSLKNPLYTSAATTGGFTALSLSLFFIHLLFFSTSLIAKRYGQNDHKACHIIVRQGFLIATCSVPLLILVSTVSDSYFALLGHPTDYRVIENNYFQIVIFSQSIVLCRTVIESYFLGTNRSREILYASLIGMIANIPLTFLFVLGSGAHLFSGATGAAWGTVLANLLSLFYLGYIYHKTVERSWEKIALKEIWYGSDLSAFLKQGAYAGLEKFTNSFCFVCFVNMFVFYGKEVSTAISIVFSWDQIAFLPLMGMYGAVMSLYSRHLGQRNPKGAVLSLHAAVRMTFALMFIFSIIFWTASNKLATAFMGGNNNEMDHAIVFKYSKVFFQTTCLYIFANAATFLYKAALRSLGYSGWCFRFSLMLHLLLVGSCYCGVYLFGVSPLCIWWFFMAMLAILSVTFVIKFYRTVKSLPTNPSTIPIISENSL